jgi:hypothetical protein
LSLLINTKTKVKKAYKFVKEGKYLELIIIVSRNIFPIHNYFFYWNKFYILKFCNFRKSPVSIEQEVILASEEDIWKMISKYPGKRGEMLQRWRHGQRCLIIKKGGEVVAYTWLIFNQCKFITNSSWVFKTESVGGVWNDDTYIDKKYRLTGCFYALMHKVFLICEVQNIPIYSEIHFLNDLSLRSCRRIGWKVIRSIVYFSILGLKVFFIRDEKNRVRMEFKYLLKTGPYLSSRQRI